jgi:hypothetical protein
MKGIKVNKKPGTLEQGVVIHNITVRPVVRTTQDIEKWRQALQAAEALNPIRTPLYDLYADLLLDGVLTSLVNKRILGVTKTKLTFLDSTGKEVEEIKTLISNNQFRKLRRELMLQKMWGISVIELMRDNGKFKIYSAPRKHIKPQLGIIAYEQYGIDGIPYRTPPHNKYLIEVGEPDDLGLLLKAAPYVIYKRSGFGDWSNFAQIFGMPFREARYDGYNQTVRAQLEQALEQAGSAAYAILPREAEIKFHEAKGTAGSSDLYNMLRKACNEELCILLLGQTETTTSSSSSGYAQSLTHAQVEDGINQDDREEELSVLNEQVLPILQTLGYNVAGGVFSHVPIEETLSKKDKADVIVKLKTQAHLPISDDYIYEQFGIPKPDNYKELKRNQDTANKPPAMPPDESGQNGKVAVADEKNAVSNWRKLRTVLADFFAPAPY